MSQRIHDAEALSTFLLQPLSDQMDEQLARRLAAAHKGDLSDVHKVAAALDKELPSLQRR